MAFLNIVSLPKKIDEIRYSMSSKYIDLIGFNETRFKVPIQAIFLLAILNLGMISIVYVQKIFDLVNSSVFYGRLKLAKEHFSINLVRCFQKSGTSIFRDVIQGTREHRL